GTAKRPIGPTSYLDALLYREALADLGELAPWGILYNLVLTVPSGEDSAPGKTIYNIGSAVAPEHFDFFGVRFALGRDFLPEEHRADGPPVAVIDYTFWRRHMGADPDVVGRSLHLNGRPFTVIGVTPRGFDNTGLPHAVYVPAARYDDVAGTLALGDREERRFKCLLRLAAGVRPEQAEARLAAVAASLDKEHPWPEEERRQIRVHRIGSLDLDPEASSQMLAGAVGLLLLLACANVANLLLARAAGRQREIAVLTALGAGPQRIARRLLTESGLLALAGGTLGLLVARWLLVAIRPYHEYMPIGYGHFLEGNEWIRYDDRVLGFTLLVTLVTGGLFGLAPMAHAARTDLVGALKSGRGEGGPGRRLSARQVLVVAQVTLATALLLLAGLLMRSLQGLEERSLGFDTERQLMAAVVTVQLPGDTPAERRAAQRRFYEAGRQRLAELPGVESATLTSEVPGVGRVSPGRVVLPQQPDDAFRVDLLQIGPEYFQTFGMSLLRGRDFEPGDRASAAGAAIVNQAFVDRFFADVEPLGQELRWAGLATDAADDRFRVVGVAPDVRHASRREEPAPLVYLPLAQYVRKSLLVAVARTAGPPGSVLPAARRALATAHPNLAVTELGTFDEITYDLMEQKLQSLLSGLFGLFGLVLACLGIYGVMSCAVSYRLRELGIRAALGATARDLVRLILGEASRLTAIGVLFGMALTLAATKLIASLLYSVSAADPLTFFTLPAALALIALAAAWLPAWRAGRVDPKAVLQEH
ncbi:MAG: ADOP family duplicated permease, partial [Acidobacteriota bacterium]